MASNMAVQSPNRPAARGEPFYRNTFAVLDVVSQYDAFFKLGLTDEEKSALIQDVLGPVAAGSSAVHEQPEDPEDAWPQ